MTRSIIAAAALTATLAAPTALAADDLEFDFEGFDEIVVEGVYEVEVTVGGDYSVRVSGDDKWLGLAEVSKQGDRLVLALKDGKKRRMNWRGDSLRAVVTMPALDGVVMEGVGSFEADGIDADVFTARLEGVGSVELSGRCGALTAAVEGVGSLDARGLRCEEVDVTVEGIGSAEVYASQSVDASMEGMGSIDVWGKPADVKRSKTFMSSIDIH